MRLQPENMALGATNILLGLALALLLARSGPAFGEATKTFTGKIIEIARGTELDVDKHENFYILRLEEYPQTSFRLSPEGAVRFGVIDPTGISGLLTPRMSKGLGWDVKLTCGASYSGNSQSPTYRVITLERLGG